MFDYFRRMMHRASSRSEYTFLARYREGSWLKRLTYAGDSPEDALRAYTRSNDYNYWVRVSPVTKV